MQQNHFILEMHGIESGKKPEILVMFGSTPLNQNDNRSDNLQVNCGNKRDLE